MLLTIAAVLLIIWMIAVLLNVLGGIVHILLVAAVAVFLYDLVTQNRRKS